MPPFVEQHSGELTILFLSTLILGSLLILVPQLLRSHLKALEMQHAEHLRALEQGLPPQEPDARSLFAGRTALLVPMVVICTCGTVTCFLVAYRHDLLFSVSLAVWCVGGVVSLAAITGGVALMGRLAQLQAGAGDEEFADEPAPKG
jgi:hypothetical protein